MAGRGRNIGARVLFSYDCRPLRTFDIKPGYRALAGTMARSTTLRHTTLGPHPLFSVKPVRISCKRRSTKGNAILGTECALSRSPAQVAAEAPHRGCKRCHPDLFSFVQRPTPFPTPPPSPGKRPGQIHLPSLGSGSGSRGSSRECLCWLVVLVRGECGPWATHGATPSVHPPADMGRTGG